MHVESYLWGAANLLRGLIDYKQYVKESAGDWQK